MISPCSECGAKPNRGKIVFHKKNCSANQRGCSSQINIDVVTNPSQDINGIEAVATVKSVNPEVIESNLNGHSFNCCNLPMRRTDGANYDQLCRHRRLLTAPCEECRNIRHGSLIYVCSFCGRQIEDAPGKALGNDAMKLMCHAR